MTRVEWPKVEELFHAALERPPAERRAFLDGACGADMELRREVESLLAQETEAERLMQQPAADDATQPVAITRGTRLGPYEVTDLVGAGGMGEVYRATDTRLGREVAVKVLPAEFASDPERLGRFEREAKAVASLNHPHILTVHDVGRQDDIPYVVTELLEGETLRERLERRPPTLKQALSFAIQAAQGLAAAHRKGVVHRDVKPENLFVTADGTLKVLDFGLAKQVPTASGGDAGAMPSTATQEGLVLGTAAYMSPEQGQGLTVDARSDIFSFGVVLYELLTHRHPFRRDTKAATLGAIVETAPKPPRELAPALPHDLEKVVLRCLRKEPARRFQHMDDVDLELEEIAAELDARSTQAQASMPGQRRRRWIAGAAAVLALVGVSGWLFWHLSPRDPPPPAVAQLTSYPGSELDPALSPDGRQVAFAWNGEKGDNSDIYVQMIDGGGQPLRLTTDPAVDGFAVWSPDGRQLAFRRQSGAAVGLYVVPALGGPERKVADLARSGSLHSSLSCSWTPDGEWLAAVDVDGGVEGIFLFPVDHGERRRLISDAALSYRSPVFSPDGRLLAYAACPQILTCGVHVLPLSADLRPEGPPRQLAKEPMFVRGMTWAPDGQSLIYAASREGPFGSHWLWRLSLSGSAPPERIELAGIHAISPSASRAVNRLVFSRLTVDVDIWKLDIGARSSAPLIASTRDEVNPQLSPDGKRLAFASNRTARGSTGRDVYEIFVSDADGSNVLQLTRGPGVQQGSPDWSPDGYRIAFDSQGADANWDVYVIDSAGGAPRLLETSPADEHHPTWSRDGRFIYFTSNRTGRFEIWRLPVAGGEAIQVTLDGGFWAQESMDGRTLFYCKRPPSSIFFARPEAGGEEEKLFEGIGSYSWWSVSGHSVYYFGLRNDSTPGAVLRIFDLRTRTSRDLAVYNTSPGRPSVSPDQKTVVFDVQKPPNADLMLIENFR